MEQPSAKKQKTTERSIVCVEGIHIDEKDYRVAKKLFPACDLTEMTQMQKLEVHEPEDHYEPRTILEGVPVEIGGKSNGFRIRKLNWMHIENKREGDDEDDDDHYANYCSYNDFGSEERLDTIELMMLDNDELDALEVLHISIPRVVIAGHAPLWLGRLRNLQELQIEFTRNVQKLDYWDMPEYWSDEDRDFRPPLENFETPRWIGNLTNLKKLHIVFSGREGSQLPDEIGKLVNLETLQIRAINYPMKPGGTIKISSCIGELTNLKHLDLRHVRNLPDEIGNLTNLEELRLVNVGEALPVSCIALSKLKRLTLRRTSMENLETVFTKLTNLEEMRIVFEGEESPIPDTIGQLTKLRSLELKVGFVKKWLDDTWYPTGRIVSIPSSIGNLTNLKHLDIGGTEFIGLPGGIGGSQGLPDTMWNLINLKYLDLSFIWKKKDWDRVKYPDGIGRLTNLEELNLLNNADHSYIPSSLGNLVNLKALHVPLEEYNYLDFLPSMENLEYLVLGNPFDLCWNDEFEDLRNMSKTFEKIVPLLVQLKNLRSLKIQPISLLYHGSLLDVAIGEEENIPPYDNHEFIGHMVKLLDGCPFLGCLGEKEIFEEFYQETTPEFCVLAKTMLQNRFRYLNHSPVNSLVLSDKQVPRSLWPFILYKATSERRELLCSKFCTCNKTSSCCNFEITEFDAMFQTLLQLLPSEKLAQ